MLDFTYSEQLREEEEEVALAEKVEEESWRELERYLYSLGKMYLSKGKGTLL